MANEVSLAPAINVVDLTVRSAEGHEVLDNVSLSIQPGTVMGVIGESGAGKSTLLRAMAGWFPHGIEASGRVELIDADQPEAVANGTELLGASKRELRSIRQSRIAVLAQNPVRSLTPTMRVHRLIAERLATTNADEAYLEALHLLRTVGLPDDDDFARKYPHQLSGGQAQRVALARGLASNPQILLLDEPTTGLDSSTQADVLDELARQHHAGSRTTVVVSHDLGAVAALADHVVVLRHGKVVEHGPVDRVIDEPRDPYTAALVDAHTHRQAATGGPAATAASDADDCVLSVRELHACHTTGARATVCAAGVSLEIGRGQSVALVGASGCGKSTIARSIVGLHRPDSGEVRLDGELLAPLAKDRARSNRWQIQLITQNPANALSPRRTVAQSIGDVLRRCQPDVPWDRATLRNEIDRLLAEVGLEASLASRRPARLSGGEQQRVAIARAIAARPRLLICDEVTSALDATVQRSVVELLASVVHDRGMAMLFITHDLGLLPEVADAVAVLDEGQVCEFGRTDEVLARPQHHRTHQLLEASRRIIGAAEHRHPTI